MLSDKNGMATIAVRDLDKARKFYEETVGLKRQDSDQPEVVTLSSGNSSVLVYRSEFAGTNKATAATWDVGAEIGEIVRTLSGKGVKFEHYDMPDAKHEGDLHVFGTMKAAWFKDPDGNILALVGE